jgi:hypothetical protein
VVSTVVAAGTGVATNVFTDGWKWPWGVALGVFVLAGIGLQLLPAAAGSPVVRASGAGSVAVGGSVHGSVTTNVRGTAGADVPVAPEDDR